jgi:hypothetical protein
MASAALAVPADAPPAAEATPRARARRRNMEGGEELLSWSWSFEARTATTATRRGSDRGAATTTRLLLRPVLVLRPAIGEGMLVDDAMKQRVMSSERKREKERPSEREAREKMLVSKSLSIVTPTWLIFFFPFSKKFEGQPRRRL